MPKHDFLTPKAISNRIKSKGLQKLRWYCQVCQKQCRDENGFKCHTTSESHQRQMLIVGKNAGKIVGNYSKMFEANFLQVLRSRHGSTRIRAHVVYNEYISDKEHIHMNATRWTTLSGFVRYLGKTSKCIIDETDEGLFMQYIDKDPRKMARQSEIDKKKLHQMGHEDRNRRFIERQGRIARKQAGKGGETVDEEEKAFQRTEDSQKLVLTLNTSTAKEPPMKRSTMLLEDGAAESTLMPATKKKRKLVLDEIMAEGKTVSSKVPNQVKRKPYWITRGIVVKVMEESIGGGKYYKQKGKIVDVQDRFVAELEMIDNGDLLQVDQDDLETVIPQVNRRVMILNGRGRGNIATLLGIQVAEFTVTVRIESGSHKGEILTNVEYEDISKLWDGK